MNIDVAISVAASEGVYGRVTGRPAPYTARRANSSSDGAQRGDGPCPLMAARARGGEDAFGTTYQLAPFLSSLLTHALTPLLARSLAPLTHPLPHQPSY